MLIGVDESPSAIQASCDISNTRSEVCRDAEVEEGQTNIPAMLPWLKGHLVTTVSNVYLGDDGTHHAIVKSRGGGQGDAVTAVLFPLVYRRVTTALQAGAATLDPEAREYAYQDDADLICTLPALAGASAAFGTACAKVKLRANLKHMTVTLGRDVNRATVPTSPGPYTHPTRPTTHPA